MSVLQPWDAAFLVLFAVHLWIRARFAVRTRNNLILERRSGRRELLLLAGVAVTCVVNPLLYLFTPWLSFADYGLPGWLRGIGLAVFAGALWMLWRTHSDLGLNWSPTLEIRAGQEVVRTGVYRRIRHPMYASVGLCSVGQGLLLGNWLAGWGGLVGMLALYCLRTPQEEAMMREHFGVVYERYCSETGRLIPPLAGFRRAAQAGVVRADGGAGRKGRLKAPAVPFSDGQEPRNLF